MGFPYESSIEDCFTGIQAESGRVTEFISCNRMETSFVVATLFCGAGREQVGTPEAAVAYHLFSLRTYLVYLQHQVGSPVVCSAKHLKSTADTLLVTAVP
ncbi:hypothetical protein KOW79_000099 [Hemibagrus wyckioides]|uniref:Uncharacterized protein n=1 Tax=Hemibagrus wyckioides TaxID=337641 RepID=A0A9D3SCG6_9TELE|nr:hypothetical protein KOW79_000099 [Hemibagrus wyckioides]